MKRTLPCGKFWLEEIGSIIYMGLTAQSLDAIGQVHVLLPKNENKEIDEDGVLCSIESCNVLTAIRSPIKGKYLGVTNEALTKPFSITVSTPVFKFDK